MRKCVMTFRMTFYSKECQVWSFDNKYKFWNGRRSEKIWFSASPQVMVRATRKPSTASKEKKAIERRFFVSHSRHQKMVRKGPSSLRHSVVKQHNELLRPRPRKHFSEGGQARRDELTSNCGRTFFVAIARTSWNLYVKKRASTPIRGILRFYIVPSKRSDDKS